MFSTEDIRPHTNLLIRTFEELDIMFIKGIPARKFSEQDLNTFDDFDTIQSRQD